VPPGGSGHVMRSKFDDIRLPVPKIAVPKAIPPREGMPLGDLYKGITVKSAQFAATKSEPLMKELSGDQREFAGRLSLSFACLAVCFAAAPLGARAQRSGRSYTFAIGFAIIGIYYVLQMLCDVKALLPLWAAVTLAWAPNLALCAAGMVFLWRVDRV